MMNPLHAKKLDAQAAQAALQDWLRLEEKARGHAHLPALQAGDIWRGQTGLEAITGPVHGGWYATMLDSALGCAVHTMLPAGRGYTTTQLNLQLVRSIPLGVERVQAVGEVVHCGRQLATAQSQLLGPDGSLYAHATCTCLIFDLPESTSR